MKVYTRKINGKQYSFRLTIGAQRELREKYHEDTIQTILSAPADPERMSDLLSAAASYPGNENTITDGDALYDMLVDDGVCGQVGFMEVAALIAGASGIMDEKLQSSLSKAVRREWDRIVAGIEGKPADPTSVSQTLRENPEPGAP